MIIWSAAVPDVNRSSKNDLLPCPFCGKSPEVKYPEFGSVWVGCMNRECVMPYHDGTIDEETFKLWNTRAADETDEPYISGAYCGKHGASQHVLYCIECDAEKIAAAKVTTPETPAALAACEGKRELLREAVNRKSAEFQQLSWYARHLESCAKHRDELCDCGLAPILGERAAEKGDPQ